MLNICPHCGADEDRLVWEMRDRIAAVCYISCLNCGEDDVESQPYRSADDAYHDVVNKWNGDATLNFLRVLVRLKLRGHVELNNY